MPIPTDTAEHRPIPDARIVLTLEDSYGVKLSIIDFSLIPGKISRIDGLMIDHDHISMQYNRNEGRIYE